VLQRQVILAGLVCFVVLRRLATSGAPRLFALHVGCMAPMLPLGTAAVSTIRQRKRPPAVPIREPGGRKKRAEWLVIRHFFSSAAALYAAAVGLGAIYLQKEALGRPHLQTPHAFAGVLAFGVWLAAYLSAQPHVWRDQIRARRFSLLRNKRWLWGDKMHRDLGKLAFALSLVAIATGMLGWKALAPCTSRACSVAVAAIGAAIADGEIALLVGAQQLQMALAAFARSRGGANDDAAS